MNIFFNTVFSPSSLLNLLSMRRSKSLCSDLCSLSSCSTAPVSATISAGRILVIAVELLLLLLNVGELDIFAFGIVAASGSEPEMLLLIYEFVGFRGWLLLAMVMGIACEDIAWPLVLNRPAEFVLPTPPSAALCVDNFVLDEPTGGTAELVWNLLPNVVNAVLEVVFDVVPNFFRLSVVARLFAFLFI